ncbi:hypothetical protein C8F01DRAFT_1362286 [Mycena amicta]|nr:hypothetical protein C8F01DRAFT_1362286 [Mycena amicta]
MAFSFPQELIAQIVGLLTDDAESLRTSALIHPSFLHSARTGLFSTRSVRLTRRNVYAFRALVASSPDVLPYIRSLNICFYGEATLDAETLLKLRWVTHLTTQSDPFGFRLLTADERAKLSEAVGGLRSVEIDVDKLYALPYWAMLLDNCEDLQSLKLEAYRVAWKDEKEVTIPMQVSTITTKMRLRSLRAEGNVKILTPLAAWLLPRGALDNLQSLMLNGQYSSADYQSPEEDRRPALVKAAMGSVKELTLYLDPPMTLDLNHTLAGFPQLRALHLRDGPGAKFARSLQWIVDFLALRSPTQHPSLEEITLDHGVLMRELLDVPAETWVKLQDALLGPSSSQSSSSFQPTTTPYPALRTFTLLNPPPFFEDFVIDKMGRMVDDRVLKFAGDDHGMGRRMWGWDV